MPLLVEAERLRPNLESLMAEADYLVTSEHFPEAWTGEACFGDAMLGTALRLPRLRFMVCCRPLQRLQGIIHYNIIECVVRWWCAGGTST